MHEGLTTLKYRRTAIILSGGVGNRMGDGQKTPKQYVAVAGRPVIGYTLLRVREWRPMDSLIIVAEERWREYLSSIVSEAFSGSEVAFLGFSNPGENRQFSIINALRDISSDMAEDAVVMIHDAVRPGVTAELIAKCDAEIGKGDGVMPYLHVNDTVYFSEDGKEISSNLDRSSLVAGQTPEFFDYWKYYEANKALSEEVIGSINGSTEPAVMAGMKMILVKGEEGNFKITTKDDLDYFRRIKEGR